MGSWSHRPEEALATLALRGLAGERGARGLRDLLAALCPGGVLAVWSAFPDGGFAERLRRARCAVEEVEVADPDHGQRHILWFATRPG